MIVTYKKLCYIFKYTNISRRTKTMKEQSHSNIFYYYHITWITKQFQLKSDLLIIHKKKILSLFDNNAANRTTILNIQFI